MVSINKVNLGFPIIELLYIFLNIEMFKAIFLYSKTTRFLISTIRAFFIFTIISMGRIGHAENFFRIPVVDLDQRHDLQVVVDKEEGVYLGHPSTVLLEDGKTF